MARLIAELANVLPRPQFTVQAAERRAEAYIAALAGDPVTAADPADPPATSPDPGDDYVIALARAAGADVIVSRDRHCLISPTSSLPL